MIQNNTHSKPHIDYPYLSLPDIEEKDIEKYKDDSKD